MNVPVKSLTRFIRGTNSTMSVLAIPRHNLSFGSRFFRVSAPRIWNSLTRSSNSRSMSNLSYIQMSLKDPLLSFSLFCHLASIVLCALILSETLALYKSFTYLLTNVNIDNLEP